MQRCFSDERMTGMHTLYRIRDKAVVPVAGSNVHQEGVASPVLPPGTIAASRGT